MRATGRTAEADRLNADSARHLEKQCTGGDFTACLALADLYDAGHGVEQSTEKVRALRERACRIGAKAVCE